MISPHPASTCWETPAASSRRLCLVQGDITAAKVDAIVNAANAGLRGGSGVDGAIHSAAGHDELQAACREIIAARGPLNPGEAVITPGFALPARWIIHTVGPIWQGGYAGEEAVLRACYVASCTVAQAHGARSIAFPAVSCGIYGYPVEQAATVALSALRACLRDGLVEEAAMWLYSPEDMTVWMKAGNALYGPSTHK